MGIVIKLILNSLAVYATAYLLPGIQLRNFLTALVVAIVLGLVNAIIRPILVLLTLPINILTLGLFTLVINGLLVLLVSALVPDFEVRSFGWAVAFAVVLWLISWFLNVII
jgi:putative membrane protein